MYIYSRISNQILLAGFCFSKFFFFDYKNQNENSKTVQDIVPLLNQSEFCRLRCNKMQINVIKIHFRVCHLNKKQRKINHKHALKITYI